MSAGRACRILVGQLRQKRFSESESRVAPHTLKRRGTRRFSQRDAEKESPFAFLCEILSVPLRLEISRQSRRRCVPKSGILSFSLRGLCDFGVSAVNIGLKTLTAETQRTQRGRREFQVRTLREKIFLRSRAGNLLYSISQWTIDAGSLSSLNVLSETSVRILNRGRASLYLRSV